MGIPTRKRKNHLDTNFSVTYCFYSKLQLKYHFGQARHRLCRRRSRPFSNEHTFGGIVLAMRRSFVPVGGLSRYGRAFGQPQLRAHLVRPHHLGSKVFDDGD